MDIQPHALRRISQRYVLFFIFLVTLLPGLVYSKEIRHYRPKSIPAYLKKTKKLHFIIRAFEDETDKTQFLIVDPSTFKTSVVSSNQLYYRPIKKN